MEATLTNEEASEVPPRLGESRSGEPSQASLALRGPKLLEKDICPSAAIKAMSPAEYAATTKKKRADIKKGKQFSKQPKNAAAKTKGYR